MRQMWFDGVKQFSILALFFLMVELLSSHLDRPKTIGLLIQSLIFTLILMSFRRYLYHSTKIKLYFVNKGPFLGYLLSQLEKTGYYPTVKIGNFIYFEDKASLFKTQLKLEVRERDAILTCPVSLRSELKNSMGTYTLDHLARI